MTQATATREAKAQEPPAEPPPGGGRSSRRLWPRPQLAAPVPVLVAVGLAGLVTVLTEPLNTVGIAGAMTGLAIVAVPVTVVATSRAAARRLLRPLPLLALATAPALLSVGTFRAAAWLYALCVVTAVWLISYAVTAGRRWPAVLLGGTTAWAAVFRARTWLAGGVKTVVMASRAAVAQGGDSGASADDAAPSDEADGVGRARLGLLGVTLLTIAVLVVFGALLASADEEFGRMLGDIVAAPSPDLGGRTVVGVIVAAFALGVAYVARFPPRLDRIATSAPRAVRPYEWAIPAGALVLLFAAFTVVQFTALFGGQKHLTVTDGLTYATYARSGFGELVTVTVLTLGVLAAVARWAPRRTPSQRNLVRGLAGAICLFTLVIVASAVYRMDLYQQAYGLTRLRLVVTTFELWLGVVFILVLIAGVRLRATWLPRAVVGTAVAALLGLAALNPDAYIAERNVERFEQTGRIDTFYLNGLSADATSVLMRLPEPERSCALGSLDYELAVSDSWSAFNVSRQRARSLLEDRPVDEGPACAARN